MKPISLYEFAGSEDVLREFQKRFLPFFAGADPVLDIGCGRGVFLELLSSVGISSVGLDHSSQSVDVCRQKGFNVLCKDAHEYLAETPEQFGGIFCSHVIEHMDYEAARALLSLCYRALRPRGVLVLLTPNPEDITIISEVFWLDPTHVRPYPRLLLESMLHASGFEVKLTKQFLGNWRFIGRRNLPLYLLRRALLGRHFGKPNTLVIAEKAIQPVSPARENVHCQNPS